ncbi:MAG: hypothetical protein QXF26_08805, partial [Candidatus Bathyarchaeia archaeon]
MGIVGSRAYESRVNIALAQLLERIGFRERAERITKEGRADIILLYGGLRIGLEGSYNALDAQRDAERKLEVGLCDLAIALWYDGSLFPQDLSESEIKRRLESSVQRI